jgi:ComF family protein
MNWWSRFLDFVSPRLCVVCGRRLSPTERSLCSVCQLHLPRTAYQFSPDDNPMAQLFWHLTPIERAAAFIYYQPRSEMARMVYQLKYGNSPDVGEDLGRLMATDMQLAHYFDGIDLLVPVPLTKKRQRQRGYNQSEMLARGISDITHLPIAAKALKRQAFHESQTHLSRRERQENVNDVFVVADAETLKGRHVLLIDDVCTTGATLTACAQAIVPIEGIRISVLTLGLTKD